MWPEMPVLFITSRDQGEGGVVIPGVGRGVSRQNLSGLLFPYAYFGAKIGPLAIKLREINSSLGDPLPLRSMEIENVKRRYLRYLKRARYVEIAYSKVSVGTFKQS